MVNQMNRNQRVEKEKNILKSLKIISSIFLVLNVVLGVWAIISLFSEPDPIPKPDPAPGPSVVVSTEETTESENPAEIPSTETGQASDRQPTDVQNMIKEMSLEDKVMQMFIISPEVLVDHKVKTVIKAEKTTEKALNKYKVGGINFGAANLSNPEQMEEMLDNMQKYSLNSSGIPLFLSLDEEGGTVSRMSRNRAFNIDDVGNMKDVTSGELAYEKGDYIGKYLSDSGINLNTAPVMDVLTNKKNEVVKYRSFGSDPEIVSEYGIAFLEGLHNNNVLGCLKHFPGHGGTAEDSHDGAAILNSTMEELEKTELVPFQNGINAGAKIIMVGHITVPNVTEEDVPATVSYELVTELLREKMGFNGIVISDAMNMDAITNLYGPGEAAVKAVQAGVDMILIPADFNSAYQAILTAIEKGEITEERINESVERILSVKKDSLSWSVDD